MQLWMIFYKKSITLQFSRQLCSKEEESIQKQELSSQESHLNQ